MEARSAQGRRCRPAVRGVALAFFSLFVVTGCGNGPRQDENEPSGNFKVEVTRASFPGEQKLAKTSELVLTVRNADTKTIPNIAVTLTGFETRVDDPRLADRSRPTFVINGNPVEIGNSPEEKEAAPSGCDTAYNSTWACGPLRPGRERTFKWRVTAVKAGKFALRYRVAAGLNGKAKAVGSSGRPVRGMFAGTVSNAPPRVRVAEGDGRTIVRGTR